MQFSAEVLNRIPVIPAKAGIQWPNCVTPVRMEGCAGLEMSILKILKSGKA